MDTLVSILGSGVVSGVTALLSIDGALQRFKSERWCERKAESYSRIVEALFELSDFTGSALRTEARTKFFQWNTKGLPT